MPFRINRPEMVPQQTMTVCPPYNSWVNSESLFTYYPQSQQWRTKLFFFSKKNSNSCNFANQDIGKLPLFLLALLIQLTPDNAPPPPTLQLLLRSINEVYPTVLLQPAHLTTSTFNKLNIKPCQLKKEQYPLHLFSFFMWRL